jgi:hypothetical protein
MLLKLYPLDFELSFGSDFYPRAVLCLGRPQETWDKEPRVHECRSARIHLAYPKKLLLAEFQYAIAEEDFLLNEKSL